MRFEKLEIRGFKSFADKTEFHFQPGMTVFVGPNGCGKSNVVDAVKWVLGEQRVKSLRGNEMQDVLFNGARTRRSTGMAEVTLTLADTKGALPTEYDSVSVTRRLYRSGESEYLLNKQRCRLRDIRELFMDTGIGMDAYSIIEQGKVEALVTANSQDRRAIFEEAAGISKYKTQKQTCLRKLDRVDSNLQRLNDIIDEVERRMRSVKYQAAKARRWKRLDDRRRELAIALALHQYKNLTTERSRLKQELDEIKATSGNLHAASDRLDAELTEMETAVIEAEQTISQLQSEDVRISSRLEAAEDAIRMNEERIVELDKLEESTKEEIATAEAALEMMRDELDRDTERRTELEQAIERGTEAVAERRKAVEEMERRLAAIRTEMEDQRAQAVDLANERANCKNELISITTQRRSLLRADERLAERLAEHREQLAQSSRRKKELDDTLGRIEGELGELGEAHAAASNERQRLARALDELGETINKYRSDIAGTDSRLEVLNDLEEKQEGLGGGVRRLMEGREHGEEPLAGILGVLADVIEVDVEHAPAIEAALGTNDQLVVTEDFATMARALRFLACSEAGTAAFLPLDAVGDAQPIEPHASHRPGVVGRCIDCVRCPPEFRPALHFLLGDILIVRDLDTAAELAATDQSPARYATLDGHLINPYGVSRGGTDRAGSGVISRRSELRALEDRRTELEAGLNDARSRHRSLAEEAEQAANSMRQIDERIEAARTERTETRSELANLGAAISRLNTELEAGESEHAENASLIESLDEQAAERGEEADRLEQAEAELHQTLARRKAEADRAEAARDEARNEANQLEVAQAGRIEKKQALDRRTAELRNQIGDRTTQLENARRRIETCTERRRQAHQNVLDRKRETGELLQERGRLGSKKAKAANRLELVRGQFRDKRAERDKTNRQAKEIDDRLQKLQVSTAQIDMKVENLEERTAAEFECSLADGHDELPECDWDAMRKELAEVEGKIKSMGSVNTYAIEELDELEGRAEHLKGQQQDLERAEHTLREIIRKINRKSREMFQQTFEDVRENFQVIFRKLFAGGRADIQLEDDVDILDAGVEIIACPPGKDPASITLLSGGEKAMTAVALLFAIFRSKPSPFCILDEVDAALDENNIDRFCRLLREFLTDSQFIVVSHARRTIALADALYGITMQEPGVSTQVSVKFEDDEDVAAAG